MKSSILILLTIVFFSCNQQDTSKTHQINKKNIKKDSIEKRKDALNPNIIFSDSAYSSIKIVKNTQKQIIEEKFCNVSYNYETIIFNGKLKFVYKRELKNITRCAGVEGQQCQYRVDFYNQENGKHLKTIIEDVDELDFKITYYLGTKWGCCGAENENFIKNTDNGKLLLEFNERYLHVEIPNSTIELFCGFKPADRQLEGNRYKLNENLTIGKLYYSDLNGIINTVIFHAKDENTYQGILNWTPEIEFIKSVKDNLRDNELESWTNNGIKDVHQINNVGFLIVFLNENSGQTDTLKYKIHNGLLNGIKETEIHDTIKFTTPPVARGL